MDTYTCNNFMGLVCWLIVGICLWLLPQAIFNLGRSLERQVCKCGQPIEYLHYYIVERHNAVILLPSGWDTNKELTSRPVVGLRSNTAMTTDCSDAAKPFCCRPPPEQARILFKLTESTLKRHYIPCFIMPVKESPSDSHECPVARWGSLKIDKFFLGEEELIQSEYSRELEGHISEIIETFDAKEGLTFSSTQLWKREDL
ncbi:hypothetical protein F5882DRAFT_376770 [Hyaloscypha sp. PMI_1271]|nr:hypothetical protein F5882DRAFT_376770 [Hyaloscypha sp. PMI_1271]